MADFPALRLGGLDDFQEIGFVAVPDGGWALDRTSLSPGAKATTVGGRSAIVRDNGGRLEVVVSDGANLLLVSSRRLSEAETVAAAEAVLATLTPAP